MTVHYFNQADAHALVDDQPTKMGPQVILTKNSTMKPEQVVHSHLTLPPAATQTHVFSALQNVSLISVGHICDDDCQAIFNKKNLQVLDKNKNIILTGKRNISDSIWDIPLTPTHPP